MIKLSVRTKIIIIGFVPVFLFLLLKFGYILPSLGRAIYAEKETQTSEMVSIAMSVLDSYYKMETSGQLSREEAQERAKETIKSMTFGEDNRDYYWINDYHPSMIMHPFRSDLDGEDISDFKDPDGLNLFVKMVETCRADGAGFVPYKWQYYADKDRIEPKLSYVEGFEPWEWIVGTGIYIHDVDAVISSSRNIMMLFTLLLTAVTTALIILITKPIVRIVKDSTSFISEILAEGNFGVAVPDYALQLNDEFGELARGLDKMIDSIKEIFMVIIRNQQKVQDSTETLAASSEQMNASLEEVAASTGIFTDSAQNMASNSGDMKEAGDEISRKAQEGNHAVDNAVQQMRDISEIVNKLKETIVVLGERTQGINKVVDTIRGIAEQTNLLALNAAIEAARAGDQGRGFAVVAEEVRKLAEQSAKSTTEITDMVNDIQNQTNLAVRSMDEGAGKVEAGTGVVLTTGDVLKEIIDNLGNIAIKIDAVTDSAQEIGATSEEVSASLEAQTATMNEVAMSAADLQNLVSDLDQSLKKFKF